MTVPALYAPVVLRHAIWLSGVCSMIWASHSTSLPPMLAFQNRFVSPSCLTRSTPSMNCGNSSNCVHWLYTVLTGASTTIDFSTVFILLFPLSIGFDFVNCRVCARTQNSIRWAHFELGWNLY